MLLVSNNNSEFWRTSHGTQPTSAAMRLWVATSEACMRTPFLFREALDCRRLAAEFSGRPEAPLLLRLADEFEHLSAHARRVPAHELRSARAA